MLVQKADEFADAEAETISAKATAMGVLLFASLTFGLIPIKLQKWFNWDKNPKANVWVSVLLCIGGGVLLCTTFIHLLPEVAENIAELQEDGRLPEINFHLAELLMCIGFFVMYFVEESVHGYIDRRNKKNEMEKTFQRTLSIRRGSNEISNISSITDLANEKNISTIDLVPPSLENPQINSNGHGHSHAHHSEHGHDGHSHLVFEDSLVISLRGLLIVLALSIHELFEGLAVGLESSASNVWYMFGAVSAHKLVIAFCIGVELVTNKTKKYLIILYVGLFAVVSPLGIGIGIGLSHSSTDQMEVASVFLQGLASGTLLYVVFFEILQKDRTGGMLNYFSIVLGFCLMFGLTFICKYFNHFITILSLFLLLFDKFVNSFIK